MRLERRVSEASEEFGKGAIEVAGPEAASNGATAGAMVPCLSLGYPILRRHRHPSRRAGHLTGIQLGPLLISQRPRYPGAWWPAMCVGNAILLVLNLPLVDFTVSTLRLPQHMLATLSAPCAWWGPIA